MRVHERHLICDVGVTRSTGDEIVVSFLEIANELLQISVLPGRAGMIGSLRIPIGLTRPW